MGRPSKKLPRTRQVAENGSSAMTLAFLRISCQTPELLSKAPGRKKKNDGPPGSHEEGKNVEGGTRNATEFR